MNRADRMLAVLRDGRPHSRAELHAAGGFYLTNNAASEARERGYNVTQHVRVIDGHRTWWYQLTELPESDSGDRLGPDALSDSGSAGGKTTAPSNRAAVAVPHAAAARRPCSLPSPLSESDSAAESDSLNDEKGGSSWSETAGAGADDVGEAEEQLGLDLPAHVFKPAVAA